MPDYRPIRPRIRWGSGSPGYTNELIFRTPLDEAVAWGEPSVGSAFAVAPSGVEDAWLEAYEYFLAGAARHIPTADVVSLPPATGWEGAAGWDALLAWAREKNLLRFYPDGRNLLDNPSLALDANANGVADEWISSVSSGVTGTSTVGDEGTGTIRQVLYAKNTSGAGDKFNQIQQRAYGVRPGDTLTLSVDGALEVLVGAPLATCFLAFEDAIGTILSAPSVSFTTTAFARKSVSGVAPAGTTRASAILRTRVPALNDEGTTRWKNVLLERRASASAAFIDNPGYEEVYLVEPMRGRPQLEQSLSRRVDLIFRKAARTAFAGY